jgi:LPXTG-motif cell wall-anchored protein
MKSAGMVLLLVGLSTFAFAGVSTVPEITPASGLAALALASGALLVIRGRRKK